MESDMIFLLGAKKHATRRDRSASLPNTTSIAAMFAPFLSPPRRGSFFSSYVERSPAARVHDDESAFPAPNLL
jgi:hypothetical protein